MYWNFVFSRGPANLFLCCCHYTTRHPYIQKCFFVIIFYYNYAFSIFLYISLYLSFNIPLARMQNSPSINSWYNSRVIYLIVFNESSIIWFMGLKESSIIQHHNRPRKGSHKSIDVSHFLVFASNYIIQFVRSFIIF